MFCLVANRKSIKNVASVVAKPAIIGAGKIAYQASQLCCLMILFRLQLSVAALPLTGIHVNEWKQHHLV